MGEHSTIGASAPAATKEEQADDELALTEDELSAEFNNMIAETHSVDAETDDLHEADWMFEEDDNNGESSAETLPEMQQILEKEYMM